MYATIVNNAFCEIADDYTPGDDTVALQAGYGATLAAKVSALGLPAISPTAPLCFTLQSALGNTIFLATGLSGDSLTGVHVTQGTTDQSFATGSTFAVYFTAGQIVALQQTLTGSSPIVQTPNAGLPNAFALSTLATGLLKVTTTTGALTTAVADTDYLTPTGDGSGLTAINPASISPGNANISISGNAATATNADSATIAGSASTATFASTAGTATTITGNVSNTQVTGLGSAATQNVPGTGLVKVSGGNFVTAVSGTDYLAPGGSGAALTGITASQIGSVPAGILKGSSGAFAVAVAGTDYPGLASANTFSAAQTINAALTVTGLIRGAAAGSGGIKITDLGASPGVNICMGNSANRIDGGNSNVIMGGGQSGSPNLILISPAGTYPGLVGIGYGYDNIVNSAGVGAIGVYGDHQRVFSDAGAIGSVTHSAILSGTFNSLYSNQVAGVASAVICGGSGNANEANSGTILGGNGNRLTWAAGQSAIAGGTNNLCDGNTAFILGGTGAVVGGNLGVVGPGASGIFSGGIIFDRAGQLGDGRFSTDAAMTANSNVLTSNNLNFSSADVGRTVIVAGAGEAPLPTTSGAAASPSVRTTVSTLVYGGATFSFTINPTTGAILTVTPTNGGSGYSDGVPISVVGTGSGATFTATVVAGAITAVAVNSGGTGYSLYNSTIVAQSQVTLAVNAGTTVSGATAMVLTGGTFGTASAILGGLNNYLGVTASAQYAAILGGRANNLTGDYSSILAGQANVNTAKYAITGGHQTLGDHFATLKMSAGQFAVQGDNQWGRAAPFRLGTLGQTSAIELRLDGSGTRFTINQNNTVWTFWGGVTAKQTPSSVTSCSFFVAGKAKRDNSGNISITMPLIINLDPDVATGVLTATADTATSSIRFNFTDSSGGSVQYQCSSAIDFVQTVG